MKIHDRKIDVGHCLTKFDEQGLYFFFVFPEFRETRYM